MAKSKKTLTKSSEVAESTNVSTTGGDKWNIEEKTDSNTREIERLRSELNRDRQNNITVFGIFASLVTFFSIEIQVFKNIENFWLLIGLSAFLISSMLIFVMSLGLVIKNECKWSSFFKNPVFWVFLFFLLFSFVIFVLNSKGININLQIKN